MDEIVTEITSAENWCQRLGRLDRFAEGRKNLMTTCIPNGKRSGVKRFLSSVKQNSSADAWVTFIRLKIEDKRFSLSDVYSLYADFYKDPKSVKAITQDLTSILESSSLHINQMGFTPRQFPPKKTPESAPEKTSKKSMRGNNSFVKMVTIDIGNLPIIASDQYHENTITMPASDIRGFGDKGKDILPFMRKKLHNIITESAYQNDYGGKYIVQRDDLVLMRAKSSNSPIYMSYKISDLAAVDAEQPEDAMIYITGEKQSIGIMKLTTIEKLN
jgi:CRISPR-associated endonuclease/helicase Cas3